jgi:hypothetical protein
MQLDPLINRVVIFKLRDCAETLYGTIRAFDEHGYWVENGTIFVHLPVGNDANSRVRYLEFRRIEWFQAKTSR